MPRACLLLQPVAAALALAAQVYDGPDTMTGKAPDVMRCRLRRAPRAIRNPVDISVGHAEDAVVDEQHVEVVRHGAEPAAQPLRRTAHDRFPGATCRAPPGALCPLHQSGHRSVEIRLNQDDPGSC